jgi:hypothetical protein
MLMESRESEKLKEVLFMIKKPSFKSVRRLTLRLTLRSKLEKTVFLRFFTKTETNLLSCQMEPKS